MLGISCHAAQASYNWYCVHVKDHVQPRVGAELSFVESLGGYYIDHAHAGWEDTENLIFDKRRADESAKL